MRFPQSCIILLIFAVPCHPHDPITTKLTWNREISRLVNRRCASCHRPNGPAMSLLTYAAARPWAVAISEEVLSRRMPPWDAVKGFGNFQSDMSLTQEEMNLFAEWVAGGAPEGDPALLPPTPSAPATPPLPPGETLALDHPLTLSRPITLLGIRPGSLPPGATAQLTARRPDGSVEPLLWLHDFHPAFPRTYVYADPILLPAGTTIRVSPAAGPFTLLYRSGLRSHK